MPNIDLEQERDLAQEARTGAAILRGRAFDHRDNPDRFGPPCDASLDERRQTLAEYTAMAREGRAARDFLDGGERVTTPAAGFHRWPILRAVTGAVLLALALPLAVFAHHTIEGPCETVTVLSEQGTVVHLTGAHDLTFGPLGPGEWPTEYVLEPVPAGDYHATFTKDGKIDAENDVTVEPCPSADPTPAPSPTPSASATPRDPSPTPPLRTPPPTDGTSSTPAASPVGDALAVLVLIFTAVVVRVLFAPRSRRYR